MILYVIESEDIFALAAAVYMFIKLHLSPQQRYQRTLPELLEPVTVTNGVCKEYTCRRGTGSSHSMDPGVSVQKQNFTRNPEKLAKVPGTREET